MGERDDGAKPIPDATAAPSAAIAAQDDGEHDRVAHPEAPLPEVRQAFFSELLDVPALQIRVRQFAPLSVSVLRSPQQMVSLDLQPYQEAAPGTGGHVEQALLVQSDAPEFRRGSFVLHTHRPGEVPRNYTELPAQASDLGEPAQFHLSQVCACFPHLRRHESTLPTGVRRFASFQVSALRHA